MSSFLGGGGATGGGGSIIATDNVVVYVATTGSDSNPGTITQPFLTLQRALNEIGSFDYQAQYGWTIHVADGTYPESGLWTIPISALNVLTESSGGRIIGNISTPANVIFSNVTSFTCNVQYRVILHGITFSCTVGVGYLFSAGLGAGDGLRVSTAGFRFIDVNVDFNTGNPTFIFAVNSASVMDFQGTLNLTGSVNVTGMFSAFHGGVLNATNFTLNSDGNQAASDFIYAEDSYISWTGVTVSGLGSIGGAGQCNLTNFVYIITDTGVPADLPGNASQNVIDPTTDWVSNATGGSGFVTQSNAGIPTTSQLPTGTWGVWKDTGTGNMYVAANDGGTIKTVALV